MKTLLTIVMVLGAVITLEATQPSEAAITQPIVSHIDHSQVTPACGYHTGLRFIR